MRVLIADDDLTSRRGLEALLAKWDYEVVVADNGADAWNIVCQDDPPKLAILDWLMPGMDGIEVCRQIRARGDQPYVYVVLLTTKAQKADLISGLEAGADDYLVKPFDASELRTRLRAGQRVLAAYDHLMERKRLEEQLRQAQKMEAVGRLAGGIAHDFNNMLSVIGGYSELVRDEVRKEPTISRYMDEIQKAAGRATALTHQLLAFGRKQVLQPKILDLNAIVTETERMLGRLIGENIQIASALDPRLGRVKADPGQLVQVILNLAINARDAMPDGGRLLLETANVRLDEAYALRHSQCKPGDYVMLAVSDSGVGMDAETRSHIFEPFFTTKEQGKGTGLGLATVYGIVKQSGGFIWVYSEHAHGTTFKVYLPCVDAPAETLELDEHLSEASRGNGTILLVEDESGVREVTRAFLESSGYEVLDAENPHAAIELARRHTGRIQLLLTDVVMPEMNGRELADRLKQGRPGLKTLYMSGYTDDAIIRHGVLEPGTAFLQKPFTRSALVGKVHGLVQETRTPAPV